MASDKRNTVEIGKKMMGILAVISVLSTLFIGTMTNGVSLEGYEIDNFLVGFTLFSLVYYFHFYKPNMRAHVDSIEKHGEQYLKVLVEQLNERGLIRLVLDSWFVKYSKQMDGSNS